MRKLFSPSYRPEFDGLRGLCLLAVLTYHSFPQFLVGGYLAIDVFFVISGYLMSVIIVRSIEKQTFTFREFYARRVLRIIPALVIVIPLTLIAGWFLLYPYELNLLFRHATAGSFLMANWELLASMTEYFGTNSKYLPFLHLWSLSVEEQFYTFIPLFFWLAIRNRIKLIPSLLILGIASAFPFLHFKSTLPMLVYFATPLRLWEMAAGGILALSPKLIRRRNEVSLTGLLFIVGSFILCRDWQSFIGKGFAVTGTLLIMWAGTEAFFNRKILSLKFFVLLGIASYSIYLWHWPLLSLGRIAWGTELPPHIKLMLLATAFIMGGICWKFIEAPARRSARAWPWVTAIVVIGSVSFLSYHQKWHGRKEFPEQAQGTLTNVRNCANDPEIKKIGNVICRIHGTRAPEVLIVGDSHAIDKFHGLAIKDPSRGWGLLAMENCSPIAVEDRINPVCRDEVEKLLRHASGMKEVHTIILGFYGDFFDLKRINTDSSQIETFRTELRKTLLTFLSTGKKVILLIDIPTFEHYPFDCLRRKKSCEIPLENVWISASHHRPMVAELKKEFPAIRVFDPLSIFCQKGICRFVNDQTLLYRDTVHLSEAGSELYAESFLKEMKL